MFSFIPSWYGKDGSWVRETNVWYRAGEQMEFDDAVNQIKVFRMAGEEVEILYLGCMPDLRHFLHRERIDEVKVWSAFDEIQNIKGNTARQLHLNDIKWPDDTEWFYTPFLKLGYRDGHLCYRAEFNEDGKWIGTVFYENEVPAHKMHIDDRGFVSFIEYYRDGQPAWRVFLDRKGRWQIKEDMARKNVYVNPAFSHRFDRLSYRNLGEIIEETLGKHLRNSPESSLVAAFDERHNEIIRRRAGGRKTAFSIFSQRTDKFIPSKIEELFLENRLVVTDTEYLAGVIRKRFPGYADKVLDISPYDARLALGKSTQIKALKILFYMESGEFERYESALTGVFRYMDENPDTFLTIGIGRNVAGPYAAESVKVNLEVFMQKEGVEYRIEEENKDIAENEPEEDIAPRIAVKECITETQIIEALSDHRIIVDIGAAPDLYLQIAGISAGLPIVLSTGSQYVSHKKNGWLLRSGEELEEALRYFLSGLANWNNSLIWSLRRIGEYTNGNIAGRWKKAMDGLTNGSDRA